MLDNMNLNADEKILTAKIKLMRDQPFFYFITMNLSIFEDNRVRTMYITSSDEVGYNSKFVDSLSLEQVKGVLAHEVMHRVLNHNSRLKSVQYPDLAAIAVDLAVNDILAANKFVLPDKGCLVNGEDHSAKISIGGRPVVVSNINMKSAEQIYSELAKAANKSGKGNSGGGDGCGGGGGSGTVKVTLKSGKTGTFESSQKGNQEIDENAGDESIEGRGENGGFDVHIRVSEDQLTKDNPDTSGEDSSHELSEKWKELIRKASVMAKQRGTVPSGMEEIIGKLLEPRIPWRSRLNRFVRQEVFQDYTWSKPSRRSLSVGVYLPSSIKENIEMVVHTDTSGSVDQKLQTKFMSEVYSILSCFNVIKMTLIVCDAKIHQVIDLDANNRVDITSSKFRLKGGGGTSHKPVVDWMNNPINRQKNFKVLLSLTDGFSDIEHVYKDLPKTCHSMILLPECCKENKEKLAPYGEIVIMDEDD